MFSNLVQRQQEIQAAISTPVLDPSTLPIATPWSTSNLQRIVAEDVFGSQLPINTRASAMRIPAIARARNLIVATLAGCPLQVADTNGPLTAQPRWLTRTDQSTSPQLRMAWTIDDLIFYGWSLWRTTRTDAGVVDVTRVNIGDWSIDADNRISINGMRQQAGNVVLIGGLHEGLLSYGVDALRDARDLYGVVRKRLANPVPQVELHQVAGDQLTEPEIDALITRWAAARAGENGGVGYTSEHIELKEHGSGDTQLMVEARNAAALDLARAIGVSGSMIDATTPKASLNYETTAGRNQEFVDYDLALYMLPITARLSQDDLVPQGQRIVWDLTNLTSLAPDPTGPHLED